MSHTETINGQEFKVLGSIGISQDQEIYEVRTWVDGSLVYHEEAASKKQMLKWCESEIKQCRKELA